MFHVTLQDHVVKELCEFIEGSLFLYILTKQSFVATGVV